MKKTVVGNWRWVAVLTAMVVAGACGDQMGQPLNVTGPDVATQLSADLSPSFGKSGEDKADKKDKKAKKEKKGPKVKGKKKSGEEKEFKAAVRKGKAKGGKATARIGAEGGVLVFGEHTLYVPAGAVDQETKFMIMEADHKVEDYMVLALDLHANRGKGKNALDVGKDGFNVPVILCVGFGDVADDVEADDEAGIIWYRPNGDVLEAVDAYQNGAGQFCGELDHFSLWGLAWP